MRLAEHPEQQRYDRLDRVHAGVRLSDDAESSLHLVERQEVHVGSSSQQAPEHASRIAQASVSARAIVRTRTLV